MALAFVKGLGLAGQPLLNLKNLSCWFNSQDHVIVVNSAESAEEVVQLFENYHQLSEILKEKANTAGKVLLCVVLTEPI